MSSEAAPSPERRKDNRLLRPWLHAVGCAFLLVGVGEAVVLGIASSSALNFTARLGGGGLTVALWCLGAGPFALLSFAAARLAFGPRLAWIRHAKLRLASSRRPGPEQKQLCARCLAFVLVLPMFLVGSAGLLVHLIQHRHGAALIASAFLLGQAALLLAAWLLLLGVTRPIRWALRGPRFDGLTLWRVLLSLGTVLLAGATYAVARNFTLFRQVQGPALLAVVLAVTLPLLLVGRFDRAFRRLPSPAWPFGAALLLVSVLAQASSARQALLRQAGVGEHLLVGLLALSDIDQDGAPTFPLFLDCAPFDPARHPYAGELAGNGIDEDCDGEDRVTLFEHKRPTSFVRPDGPAPNLVLVTFDAARADHFGFMGYRRPTTPNIDRVAERGVVFERAFSQDSGTGPSLWSLFAGKTPFQVKLLAAPSFPPILGPEEQLLAELLRGAGYVTEAVLCGYVFDTTHWNLRRGFNRFRNVCPRSDKDLAKIVSAAAVTALGQLKRTEPFFLWVHYYDPHDPYTPHPEYGFGSSKVDRYDEELRFADTHFEAFYAELRKEPGARPLYVAIAADHGENFDEHGAAPHARNLYREVTHVPLVIEGPDLRPRRVTQPVALNDLYPTFLELARVSVPKHSTMASQVPVLFGAPADGQRIVFQENSYSRPQRHVKGAIRGRHHFLLDTGTGVEELYDYELDPRQQRNLVGSGSPEELALRRALRQFVPTTEIPTHILE